MTLQHWYARRSGVVLGDHTLKQVELYGREVILADREMVESQADQILDGADSEDVAFLVVGDPFGATTHTDLMLRARQRGIKVHRRLLVCQPQTLWGSSGERDPQCVYHERVRVLRTSAVSLR